MFDHNRLSMEEANERVRRFLKEREDDLLYRQLGQRDGTTTWFVVLIILIVAAFLW